MVGIGSSYLASSITMLCFCYGVVGGKIFSCKVYTTALLILRTLPLNRVRRQSGFPTFISCQRQDANVLPKRRQSHQGDKLCDVSTVPLGGTLARIFGPRI